MRMSGICAKVLLNNTIVIMWADTVAGPYSELAMEFVLESEMGTHNSSLGCLKPARGVMLGVVIMLLAACSGGEGQGQEAAGAGMPVDVQYPVVKEVTVWDEYIGRFEAVNRVEIRPRVSGYLEDVHFEDGVFVEVGDPLFTIDPRPFEAEVQRAAAQLESAKTGQRLAETELARSKRLLDSRAVSQEDYDRRLQAKQAADADVAGAEAALRQAELNLEFTEIKSPIAGRTSQDLVNRGNLVTAQTSLLTTIVSMTPIHFVFTASEQDYLNYSRLDRSGERASSRDKRNPVLIKLEDQDDYTIEGVMDFVDNAIDASTATIQGRAIVDNADGFLTPGMFGHLRLYGRDPFEAVLIPDTAVQFDQSRQFVWVVGENNQAEMRPVTLGRLVENDMRIVENGLAPDDRIVTSNFLALRPGAPLAPSETGSDARTGETSAARTGE